MKNQNVEYKGNKYDNDLDARWAVYFDSCGLDFDYKKDVINIEGFGNYVPTFVVYGIATNVGAEKKINVSILPKGSDYKYMREKLLKIGENNGYEQYSSFVFVGDPLNHHWFLPIEDGIGEEWGYMSSLVFRDENIKCNVSGKTLKAYDVGSSYDLAKSLLCQGFKHNPEDLDKKVFARNFDFEKGTAYIPIPYKGITYHNECHAKWAVFLDEMGIRFEYMKPDIEIGIVPHFTLYYVDYSSSEKPMMIFVYRSKFEEKRSNDIFDIKRKNNIHDLSLSVVIGTPDKNDWIVTINKDGEKLFEDGTKIFFNKYENKDGVFGKRKNVLVCPSKEDIDLRCTEYKTYTLDAEQTALQIKPEINSFLDVPCTHCGETVTHHDKIEVFNKLEGDNLCEHFIIDFDHCTHRKSWVSHTQNPSSRRHGISVYYWCELCGGRSILGISQHKGSTQIETRPILDMPLVKKDSHEIIPDRNKTRKNLKEMIDKGEDIPEYVRNDFSDIIDEIISENKTKK